MIVYYNMSSSMSAFSNVLNRLLVFYPGEGKHVKCVIEDSKKIQSSLCLVMVCVCVYIYMPNIRVGTALQQLTNRKIFHSRGVSILV